jgi:hypothetical protein
VLKKPPRLFETHFDEEAALRADASPSVDAEFVVTPLSDLAPDDSLVAATINSGTVDLVLHFARENEKSMILRSSHATHHSRST